MKMKTLCILSIVLAFAACPPKRPGIAQIEFKADPCFGECPVFEMTIFNDGRASYDAIHYNEREGQFTTIVAKPQLDSLWAYVGNAELFSLSDHYSVLMTDQPTYTLTLKLQNGDHKTVTDYGPDGPKNLQKIYDLIFSLRETQNWKK